MSQAVDEAKAAVERMQNFDVDSLPRVGDLGSALNFSGAVTPARRIVTLYKQFSIAALSDMPENLLSTVKSLANADFNRFDQILKFNPNEGHSKDNKDQYISQLVATYDATFTGLMNLISYGMSKSADLQRMENDARSMIQSVSDQANALTAQLEDCKIQAERVLVDIRKAAAEQGVSQQAIYFRDESTEHAKEAEIWRKTTIGVAILLGAFAITSLFLHKFPWLEPKTELQSLQLIASKVLIFAVVSYMLILSAKNFMSHKHNAVVNKHRQNALMTFKALADAASDGKSKDIVLTHASACIFTPQDTGYTKGAGAAQNSTKSIIELFPGSILKPDHG